MTAKDAAETEENVQATQGLTIDDVVVHYDKPWWRVPHLIKLNLCIFLIILTSTNNGYDSSMLNALQSLVSWKSYMGGPTGPVLGALSNGVVFGGLMGTSVASFISDKYGRKAGVIIGEVITVIGSILQGVSTNYAFFLISRFILGFGASISICASPPLIAELSYPTHRPTNTALYNTAWYLGALVASGITYGCRDIGKTGGISQEYQWRIPSYVQGFFPLIQVMFFWYVPESPRWLINRGRIDEARKILTKYHIGDDQSEEAARLVDFELREIETAIEMEKLGENSSYFDFVRTPGNRKRLFLCLIIPTMMQLSGNGLVSYYLSLVLTSIGYTDSTQQLRINIGLQCYNMFVAVGAATIVYRFKRRQVFLFSTIGMLVCYIIWTILSAVNQQRNFKDGGLGKGVLAMIFLYYIPYDAGQNGAPYLYISEVLNYSLRAKGINIFHGWSQVVVIYNGFVNPVAMAAITWKYYIVFCCILFCEVNIVYWFYPETSGHSLEEVGKIFGDDPEDLNHIVSAIRDEKRSLEQVESV